MIKCPDSYKADCVCRVIGIAAAIERLKEA